MDYRASVKECFTKYATFKGRAARSEYWYYQLFIAVCIISFFFLNIFLANIEDILPTDGPFAPLNFVIYAVLFIPSISATVRRLHDVGQSGWWFLLYFSGIGYFILLYWLIRKGDVGENKYGSPNQT